MKIVLKILFFLLICSIVKAQTLPSTLPNPNSPTGFYQIGWIRATNGLIAPLADTTYLPKYTGTIVCRPQDHKLYYYDSTALHWALVAGVTIDTTSLSNRINQKLNITDTTGKWLSQLTNFVDTVYRVNDSTVGYTVRGRSHSFQILGSSTGGGGGSGTVTSVGLSMPAAFSVSGSPITTSGTLSVSGTGTSLQYIKGNGTLGTFDTAAIPNFYLKVRGELSGTSPITYNSTTGAIGINNANTSGTKGAATFNSGSFSDNGSGTISLLDVISNGSCLNCQLTYDSKGRIVSASNGIITPPPINAPGAGDTLMIADDTIKRLNPGYGIQHAVTNNSITSSVDTSKIATKYDLTKIGTEVVDTFARQISSVGLDYAEQPATTQSYMWELMSVAVRSQWYDGVSASNIADTIIIFGGWNAGVSYDSVFQSVDGGQTWTFRDTLPYRVHTPAVIRATDGYTYVIGGDYLNTTAQRSMVYRTKDFHTYELRTAASPFGTRVLHGAFELNETLFCGGGQYYTLNRADGLFKDLYKSNDGGITWNLVDSSLTFLGKNISGCFTTINGIVKLISGGIYDNIEGNKTFDKTTYWSKDALHWYRGSDLPLDSGFQYPNVFSWDGKTWIVGGYSGYSHANVDSTLFLDKSGFWSFFVPPTKPVGNHAAATIVVNDIAYRILGNVTNQAWRVRRDTASTYFRAVKHSFRTRIAIDTLGRNIQGYNIDSYSSVGDNENRYTNSSSVNLEKWSGPNYSLYNGNLGYAIWEFPATRQFRAHLLRSWVADSLFLPSSFFSPMIQAQATFPAYSWQSASHTFLIGVDGNLVKFRQEDGTTGNRLGWDITNGHMALAGNTTNGYDITTDASAVLALKSSNSGFLPPVMTTTAKNAITSPTKGLDVYDTTVLRGSHYNGTSWDNVAYTTDVIPDSSIWKYDGTMNGNHTLSGNGKTLNLGSSGSKLLNFNVNASGLISFSGQFLYSVDAYSTDADHTVTSTAQICEITDALSTNRTLTLPTATLNGTVVTVVMHFSSGTNHFNLSAAVTDNATGSTFTQLDWGKTYDFLYDSGLAWRLIRKY